MHRYISLTDIMKLMTGRHLSFSLIRLSGQGVVKGDACYLLLNSNITHSLVLFVDPQAIGLLIEDVLQKAIKGTTRKSLKLDFYPFVSS
jgi:hypothetical protein